jgi:hypothetical protein
MRLISLTVTSGTVREATTEVSSCTFAAAVLAILLLAGTAAANAQETESRRVVVEAEAAELPTA